MFMDRFLLRLPQPSRSIMADLRYLTVLHLPYPVNLRCKNRQSVSADSKTFAGLSDLQQVVINRVSSHGRITDPAACPAASVPAAGCEIRRAPGCRVTGARPCTRYCPFSLWHPSGVASVAAQHSVRLETDCQKGPAPSETAEGPSSGTAPGNAGSTGGRCGAGGSHMGTSLPAREGFRAGSSRDRQRPRPHQAGSGRSRALLRPDALPAKSATRLTRRADPAKLAARMRDPALPRFGARHSCDAGWPGQSAGGAVAAGAGALCLVSPAMTAPCGNSRMPDASAAARLGRAPSPASRSPTSMARGTSLRRRPAASCWSTSSPPGASPAARNCRRSSQLVDRQRRHRSLRSWPSTSPRCRRACAASSRQRPSTFPVLLDADRAVTKAWGVDALPTTFVLDRTLAAAPRSSKATSTGPAPMSWPRSTSVGELQRRYELEASSTGRKQT